MTPNSSSQLPFGEWPSPIAAELVAAGGIGLGGAAVRGSQRWWAELRPSEAGRVVLVCHDTDTATTLDMLSGPWSARTRVHEYGGGAWSLGADSVYFSNWDDQRLYRLQDGEGSTPRPLTPEPADSHGYRYADMRETPDGNWIICVREDHHRLELSESGDCRNSIVAVAADGSERVVELASGPDFVAAPRVSPDGTRLSWFAWNHPNMPWDTTTLFAATIKANDTTVSLSDDVVVAGGEPDGSAVGESIHGSNWLANGDLVYSTDRSGYWNLHRWNPHTKAESALTDLHGAEIGAPAWVFGVQRWAELSDGSLAVVITESAKDSLGILSLDHGLPAAPVRVDLPFVTFGAEIAASTRGSVVALVGSSDSLPQMVEITPATAAVSKLRPAEDLGVETGWFSTAERFDFVSAGGRDSHAFFYPPAGLSADGGSLAGTANELPPLVVMGHGGPTAHSEPDLSLKVQYWTSRGIAVVDVNYGGSTGYGRDYRRLLNGAWGLVDVEDCVAAAEQLAAAGRVDGSRMAIRGGSAGGFTVLRALQVSSSFSAGTSLYGVADLGALARDTHKFESRYLDGLIGPYPQDEAVYDERSPINHVGDLSCPLLVMQGDEDKVVPPSQSEAIVEAVAAKGLPHCYLLFVGEQHGFRQSASIVRSLEAELWFYAKVFGFQQSDQIADLAEAVGLG